MPRIGESIGSVEIEGVLGRGSMGPVHLGRDRTRGTLHAVRVVPAGEELARRLLCWGRSYREVRHPHVVGVTDVFRADDAGRQGVTVVTPYAAGLDLGAYLAVLPPSLAQVDAIAHDLFRGLEALHRDGRPHLDLQPSNIMLSPDRAGGLSARCMDPGLAVALGATLRRRRDRTRRAHQAPTSELHPTSWRAADIYSLGAVLFHLLSGRPPGRRGLPDTVPAAWAAMVTAALAEDPAERPPSVSALRRGWSACPPRSQGPTWSPQALAFVGAASPVSAAEAGYAEREPPVYSAGARAVPGPISGRRLLRSV